MSTMTIIYAGKCKHCAFCQTKGRGKPTQCVNPQSERFGVIRKSDPMWSKFSFTKEG